MRLNAAWMEFKGVRNTALSVELLSMPSRTTPVMNARTYAVAGLSGTALVTDGSYADVQVTCAFDLLDGARMSRVNAWLTGWGLLRFSDEPGLAYEARVLRCPQHAPVAPRLSLRCYTVTFTCKPFRVQVPPAKPFAVTASGQSFENPGTAPARPRVTIRGHGDLRVTIAGQTISFTDVTDGIAVDSNSMDAVSVAGDRLLNDHMSGLPWRIPPGRFSVEWEADEGSEVTGVEVEPGWRWM